MFNQKDIVRQSINGFLPFFNQADKWRGGGISGLRPQRGFYSYMGDMYVYHTKEIFKRSQIPFKKHVTFLRTFFYGSVGSLQQEMSI